MRSRRGIASVVGMVFAIIALTTTITYISYSMGILNNYNQSVLVKNQQLTDVDKEKFQISSVTVPNGKFNITIANTGSLPIQFTKVWIQNTSATDQVYSYVPTHNFVSSGGVLTNIGQSMTPINAVDSYNVKLVTSRGNTQQFTMNSANTGPLNIQLLAIPASVDTGYNSELIMIVTNNGTSLLTNVTPSPLPTSSPGLTGFAQCTASSVSPTMYSTLAPGSTAIFKWNIAVNGADGQTCTYTLSQPIKNGYSQTVQATITVNVVKFSQTDLAANVGVLTINYTSFQWEQGSGWKTGWSFPAAPGNQLNTGFTMNVTNNNATSDFYVDPHTQLYFRESSTSNSLRLFVMNSTNQFGNSGNSYTCPGTDNTNCLDVKPGKWALLYFGAKTIQSNNMQNLGTSDTYMLQLLLFGKFAHHQSDTGMPYAQDIPFVAVLGT